MIVKTKEQLPEELANIPASKFNMKQADDVILDEEFKTEAVGFWKDAFLRLRKSKVSVISFTVIMIIVLGAIFVPNLTGYTYTEQNVDQQYLPPKIPGLEKLGIADGTRTLRDRKVESLMDKEKYPEGSIIEIKNEHMVRGVKLADVKVDSYLMSGVPEDEYHWLGTDYMGRDLCTRLFRGARISLFIALVSVLTNCIIGVIYGAISGYYGGHDHDPYRRINGRYALCSYYNFIHAAFRLGNFLTDTRAMCNGLDRNFKTDPCTVLPFQGKRICTGSPHIGRQRCCPDFQTYSS